jgi:hypothetical protein
MQNSKLCKRGAQMPNLIAPETQVRGPGDPAAFVVDPADPEAWRAQLFRTIDSDSAAGMPPGSEASALGLDSGKGGSISLRIALPNTTPGLILCLFKAINTRVGALERT